MAEKRKRGHRDFAAGRRDSLCGTHIPARMGASGPGNSAWAPVVAKGVGNRIRHKNTPWHGGHLGGYSTRRGSAQAFCVGSFDQLYGPACR